MTYRAAFKVVAANVEEFLGLDAVHKMRESLLFGFEFSSPHNDNNENNL